jgi:K+-sensing histidine kinase KdpD
VSKYENEIAELKAKLKRRENEMQSIQQIGKALSSELNRDKLLIVIMKEVTRLINAERGTLYIVDSEKGELWSKIAQKAEIKEIRLKIGIGIAGHVAKTAETINIKDAYNDPRFDPTTDKKTGYVTRSMLCMPIREPVKEEGQSGDIIGVIQILNKIDGYFTEEDEDLLTSLTSQIAISLVNSRLYSILEDRVNELNLLFNVEQKLSGADNLEEMLHDLLNLIVRSFNTEFGLMLLNSADRTKFELQLAENIPAQKFKNLQLQPSDRFFSQFYEKKKPVVSNDLSSGKIELDLKGINVQQIACFPLISDNQVTGVLILINKRGTHSYFSENDGKILTSVAGQIARGIDNLRLKEEKMKADRLATIGNMMSTIVHDLRTPMNNIYGFVDLMLEEDEQDTRSEYAEIINEQIKILTNMTTDVLDFAKGKTTILPRKYPVDKLVKDFAKFFSDDIKRKGFEFEWAVNTSSMIYIDPEKINRVFMNIMKNALEAMDKGGKFSLIADEQKGEIVFRLADTGTGIPDEIRDRLFDSFVTSGKKGGTGLGLAIVKKVIEEHKGHIEVESQKGVGTTFKIFFPKV